MEHEEFDIIVISREDYEKTNVVMNENILFKSKIEKLRNNLKIQEQQLNKLENKNNLLKNEIEELKINKETDDRNFDIISSYNNKNFDTISLPDNKNFDTIPLYNNKNYVDKCMNIGEYLFSSLKKNLLCCIKDSESSSSE